MSALPKGWVEATFAQISEIKLGKMLDKEKNKGELRPYLRNVNVRWDHVDLEDILEMRFTDEELEPFGIRDGDLLVCEGGEPGRCAVWRSGPTDLKFQKALMRLRPRGGVESALMAKMLRLMAQDGQLQRHFTGTTIKHLPQSALAAISVPLPPLAEQKRIVAKLDALNARSARARTELARIETLVSRYKQAVLSKAFSGDLTREWRSGQTKPGAWKHLPLSQLVSDGPSNGWSPKADGKAGDLKSLKLSATSSGTLRLDESTIKYLDQTLPSDSKFWLLANDILIQRANSLELLGTTVLFDGPSREFIFPDLMMRIRADDKKALPPYLATYLNSEPARAYFRANATGTAGNMPKINGTTVRESLVPTAPVEEQWEIVRRIESAFAKIDRLAGQAKRALELVGKLDEAILAKAFRGELVPQDENDEPADRLLARIRAERQAAPKAKRGRRAQA